MKQVTCPLTGKGNVEKIASFDVDKLCRDWKKQFDMDVRDEFHAHDHIDYYRCKDTDLGFFLPVDVAGSGDLYALLQKFDWFYMHDKWEHKVALADLAGSKRVLEIGSATGSFVQSALDQGLDIMGIELNESAVAVAKGNGLPVSLMDLQDAVTANKGTMDGVCSFQVLEHVSDPKAFVSAAVDLLKPGGVLILSVPNSRSFLKYQYCLLDMPPHHMTRWSATTFKALETLFAVRLEKVKEEPLALVHVHGYLAAYADHFRSTSVLGRLLYNRITMPVYQKILGLAVVRRFLTGQTIYASFRKL